MIHLNGNLLCAVDCETTGLKAGYHDLIQICVLPLDPECRPSRQYIPFNMIMQPRRPENVDMEAMSVNKFNLAKILLTAPEADMVADLFDEWFERLKLPNGKQIMPLAQNWPFDRSFIIDWLGDNNYNHIFTRFYRDTYPAALFLNDVADHNAEKVPFPKYSLRYLAGTMRIDIDPTRLHDAQSDAMVTAEVYRRMLRMHHGMGTFESEGRMEFPEDTWKEYKN